MQFKLLEICLEIPFMCSFSVIFYVKLFKSTHIRILEGSYVLDWSIYI